MLQTYSFFNLILNIYSTSAFFEKQAHSGKVRNQILNTGAFEHEYCRLHSTGQLVTGRGQLHVVMYLICSVKIKKMKMHFTLLVSEQMARCLMVRNKIKNAPFQVNGSAQ